MMYLSFELLLVCFSTPFLPSLATPLPWDVLGLSNTKIDRLQIPKSNGGGITQITLSSSPSLKAYSDSTYFYTDAAYPSGVIMFAPENGAVTGNGAGPRTELSEPNSYFTFRGNHRMEYTTQVLAFPSGGEVCVGQLKGDECDSCFLASTDADTGADSNTTRLFGSKLIVVELTFDKSGQLTCHLREKNGNNVNRDLGRYDLKEKIKIVIELKGFDVVVTAVGASGNMKTVNYSYKFWSGDNYKMHFKVGVYDQNSGNSGSVGGKVRLSALRISHSEHL